MDKMETPTKNLHVNFLARDSEEINKLVEICKLLGNVEKFPEHLSFSHERPRTYSFTLTVKIDIVKTTTDWLLDTGVVESVNEMTEQPT